MKKFWVVAMLAGGLMSVSLLADSTGNERRTVAACNSIKDKAKRQRCKACAIGKGRHFHPKRNQCHKNQGAKN